MFAEFALEPELLSNWADYRLFVSQFGASRGRLISRYPKNWRGKVKEAAKTSGEVEYLRIVESLDRIDSLMLERTHNYDKALDWFPNALKENSVRPFHAIVARDNPASTSNVIIGDRFDPTSPPDAWVVPTSLRVKRVAVDMANCVAPLLRSCSEVLFIDPYFGPGRRHHCDPLKCFLGAIASRGNKKLPTRIEYHTSDRDKDVVTFQLNLDRWVKPYLPATTTLTVARWNVDEMHNRYIVTDRGGVMFGAGLDQDGLLVHLEDTVTLLDDSTCAALMNEYSPTSLKLTWLNDTFNVIA